MPVRVTMTATASEPQLVKCQFCRREFVSNLTVTRETAADTAWGVSEAEAAAAAGAHAQALALAALTNIELFDTVPCPGCLQYQPFMARKLAQKLNRTDWRPVGFLLLIAGALAALVGVYLLIDGPELRATGLIVFPVGLGAALLGGALVALVRHSVANYDPNDEPEGPRRREAEERTQSVDEYDRKQERRVQKEYAEYTPQHRDGNPFAELEPLVVVWWVRPTVFTNGGAFTIVLSQTQFVTFTVPEIARPGVVLDPSMCPPGVRPFKVLVRAFRVHPDEYQVV